MPLQPEDFLTTRTATATAAATSPAPTAAPPAPGVIKVIATILVGAAPRAVAVNPKTNTIYVTKFNANTVSVISGRTSTVTATDAVGTEPAAVATDAKTNTAYVTNLGDNTVSLLATCPK